MFAQTLAREQKNNPQATNQVRVMIAQIGATQAIVTMREVEPEFDKHIDAF